MTEHLTAVTELTSRAVVSMRLIVCPALRIRCVIDNVQTMFFQATLVARCKNSLVTTRSVSLLFSDAMVTMTAVTKATRGIVVSTEFGFAQGRQACVFAHDAQAYVSAQKLQAYTESPTLHRTFNQIADFHRVRILNLLLNTYILLCEQEAMQYCSSAFMPGTMTAPCISPVVEQMNKVIVDKA